MSMMAFHTLFPKLAEEEAATFTPDSGQPLPEHTLLFVENYCVEENCDCRRALLKVIDTETREQVATLSYAFEPPTGIHEDEGQLFLDPINPQSEYSADILDLFERILSHTEGEYHDRLVRHYTMWKAIVNDPNHPDQDKLPEDRTGFALPPPAKPVRRSGPKVGANTPCPCGSGRKYKKCCGA